MVIEVTDVKMKNLFEMEVLFASGDKNLEEKKDIVDKKQPCK